MPEERNNERPLSSLANPCESCHVYQPDFGPGVVAVVGAIRTARNKKAIAKASLAPPTLPPPDEVL